MEDNQKKNGKGPKQKRKINQSTKINLIGCDTIVNSPSLPSDASSHSKTYFLLSGQVSLTSLLTSNHTQAIFILQI